ncbi:MAG: FHA domain-containing protein [Burkholderiaceae bacterium]|nr:FHA domain-containing protein [Burkholderiaceae bacterium]
MDRPEDRVALIELLGRDGRVQRAVDVHRWPVSLGRALDNTVVLDEPHVAAHHATLSTDGDGRPWLQVGDTCNGVRLGTPGGRLQRPWLPAGTRQPLPAAGAALQLGGQRLRLRLPGAPLEAERPLAPPSAGRSTLAGVAALWFAVQIAQRWVELDPGADFTQWLPWLLGLPIGVATWCGLWALGSRMFRHGFDFVGHAAIAMPALLALEIADTLLPALAAAAGWPLLWQLQKLLVPPLIGGWLLRSHLRHLLPQRGRAIDLTLSVLVAAGLLLGLAVNQRQQGRAFADPYMRTLPMPMLRLGTPAPTTRIDEAMAPLREKLADRVLEAGANEAEDEGGERR